jgi:hypothetical protein
MKYSWFYQLPIGLNALLILAFLLGCLEISYRAGVRQRETTGEDREMDRRGDVILTAMLALLGLMLAFTYSFTVSRSDFRKAAVLGEINAVGTAFLRADLLDEPHRTTIRTLLLEYTRTLRLDARSAGSHEGSRKTIEQISAKQAPIWPSIREMAAAHPPNPLTNSMVQSITSVFDAHARRFKAAADRLPAEILAMLLLVAVTCLSVHGFSAGRADSLRRWRTTALVLVLAGVTVVIVDFDRPLTGFVRTDQQGYFRLIDEMEAALEE